MRSKIFVFFLGLYILSLIVKAFTYLTSPESALPVTVILTGDGREDLADVSVGRLSAKGAVKPLIGVSQGKKSARFGDVAQNVYYKSIRITFTDKQLASLLAVNICIGQSTSRYTKKTVLTTWLKQPGSDSGLTVDYTVEIANRTILGKPIPILNINSGNDSVEAIMLDRLPFLLLLLFILYSLKNKPDDTAKKRLLVQNSFVLSSLFTAAVLVYKLPFSVQPVGYGLDPSWITALNWAQYKGLNWGEDLAFTYGPYFWLLYPSIVASQASLITAFVVTVVVYGYSVGTIAYYLFQGFHQKELSLTILGISLIVLIFFEFTLTDIVILVPVLVLSEEKYQYRKSLSVYGLMAILSLCKFSYLPVSICIVTFVSLKLLFRREWLNSLLNIGTFVTSTVILWCISGQPIENLALFVKRGYQIASGYSEAMGTAFWNSDQSLLTNLLVNVTLLLWGGLFVVGVLVVFSKACLDGKDWFKIFLTAPILFLAFKEGYVRMDFAHSKLFFSQLVLVLITYVLLLRKNHYLLNDVSSLLTLLILGSLLFVDASHPAPYVASIEPSFNSSIKEKTLAASQESTASHYQLTPDLIRSVGNSRVDIIPYDVSMLHAYNLNWAARPVFQSYSAYTSSLDSINADYLLSNRAPTSLLFSFSSIDNRYPLFDEPMLLRTMRTNYRVTAVYQNRFLLLQRLKKPKSEYSVATQRITERINIPISIPTLPRCDTYMHANLQLTVLGKLCNFLLKVQPPYLEVKTDGTDSPRRYRLIRQTANDGLLVSYISENAQSVALALSGQATSNCRFIKIIGNSLLYKTKVDVTFKITRVSN